MVLTVLQTPAAFFENADQMAMLLEIKVYRNYHEYVEATSQFNYSPQF